MFFNCFAIELFVYVLLGDESSAKEGDTEEEEVQSEDIAEDEGEEKEGEETEGDGKEVSATSVCDALPLFDDALPFLKS